MFCGRRKLWGLFPGPRHHFLRYDGIRVSSSLFYLNSHDGYYTQNHTLINITVKSHGAGCPSQAAFQHIPQCEKRSTRCLHPQRRSYAYRKGTTLALPYRGSELTISSSMAPSSPSQLLTSVPQPSSPHYRSPVSPLRR